MSQTFRVQAQENRSIAGTEIRYRTVKVDQFKIFYREAGVRGAPVVLLLHGFPTASHINKFPFFAVNILRADHQTLADQFAGRGGLNGLDRYGGANWTRLSTDGAAISQRRPCRDRLRRRRDFAPARPRNCNRPCESHCDSV